MIGVTRLSDRAAGWALRMVAPFTMDGKTYASGTWLIEVHGVRQAVAHEDMLSCYSVNVWAEAVPAEYYN